MISKKRRREHFSVPGDQLVVEPLELPTKPSSQKGRAEEARLKSIVDMGLGFSGMIRLFKRDSKKEIRKKLLERIGSINSITSKKEFNAVHHAFCQWGVSKIKTAKKRIRNRPPKPSGPVSYGQIAKTIDVALKAIVYYAHLPDCRTAEKISPWLNAAVDTKMMAKLRKYKPCYYPKWPKTIEEIKEKKVYDKLQKLVEEFIKEKPFFGEITPVQFDDIYWWELNRKE